MANALASQSMLELDKRGGCGGADDFYENSPPPVLQQSHSPHSPGKKFSFWFPANNSGILLFKRTICSFMQMGLCMMILLAKPRTASGENL